MVDGSNLQVVCAERYAPVDLEVSADGTLLCVAVRDPDSVVVIDPHTNTQLRAISLPAAPTGVTFCGATSELIVTCGEGAGRIVICDPSTGKLRAINVPVHSPVAPSTLPDGSVVFVGDRFRDVVLVLDPNGKLIDELPSPREPVAMAVSADGQRLVVAGLLPEGPSDDAYSASTVALIDTQTLNTVATIQLPNGSNALRDVCLSPDGRFAYVSHVLARYQLPTTQVERGWMNTNALTVIDLAANQYVNTILLDELDRGAANPWGVATLTDGKWLCVAHAGSHEVSLIDRSALHAKLDQAARPADVPNDLSFLSGLRRRVELPGRGPRTVTAVGSTLHVAEYFSAEVVSLEVSNIDLVQMHKIPLGEPGPMAEAWRGELLFHDATHCFQAWQSCASCHPSDGRADALNWDLLNDGLGNPKNTRSLVHAHQTPPAMVTGVRPTAHAAVRAGLKHIQFCVLPEEDASAIDQYLQSLRPVASPHLSDAQRQAAAERGSHVFQSAGCASCHRGSLYSDLKRHEIGTGRGRDEGMPFDTPSLIEIWRTSPYLHDGRAATIEELLTTHNAEDRHGRTSDLSAQDLADLVMFVLSL